MNIGEQGRIGGSDLFCESAPEGGCKPDFPEFTHAGVLAGLEYRGNSGAIRALGGPALFGTKGNGGGLGGLGQVDLATPTLFHIAFVLSGRGGLFARSGGETFSVGSLGLGFRIE